MLKAAKKLNPLAALKSGVKNLPMEVRMSLWVIVGNAMGLPVDEIFGLIDLHQTKPQWAGTNVSRQTTQNGKTGKENWDQIQKPLFLAHRA